MAHNIGSFVLNTSTGNQSVTGVGTNGGLVLFLGARDTADGASDDFEFAIGAMDRNGNQGATSFSSQNGVGTMNTKSLHSANDAHNMMADGVVSYRFSFVSMDTDGFTINITVAPPSAWRVFYLVIPSIELDYVDIHQVSLNTSTGTQAVTGVGFEPDWLIAIGHNWPDMDSPQGGVHASIGFATSLDNHCVGVGSYDGVGTSNAARRHYNQHFMCRVNGDGGASMETNLDSMDSDGYTLDIIDSPTGSYVYTVIAGKGPPGYVGDFAFRNDGEGVGTINVTGVGFQPESIININVDRNAFTSSNNDLNLSCGISNGTDHRVIMGHDDDNKGTSDTHRRSEDNIFAAFTADGANMNSAATVSGLNSDGFDLNQTIADDTQNINVSFLAIGKNTNTGSSSVLNGLINNNALISGGGLIN